MQKEGYVLLVGSLLVMKSSVLVVFLLSYKIQNKRLNRKIPNLEKLLPEKNLIRKKNKNDFGRFGKNLIRKTLVSVGYMQQTLKSQPVWWCLTVLGVSLL